jgi:hypothetical protein
LSHIVSIKTQVRDLQAVRAACHRLQFSEPRQGTAQLFSTEVTGLIVAFPDWRYPVVCDIPTGQLHYDNFEGRWGDESHLHRFLQAYAVEKATIEARRQGHSVRESVLTDGSIRLQIGVAS